MRPLGQTRPLLAYGVPAAAGLAVGGALAAQGEDPGTAALGGAAAALGARGGLGTARLAGKYMAPVAKDIVQGGVRLVGPSVVELAEKVPQTGKRYAALGRTAAGLNKAYQAAENFSEAGFNKVAAAGLVPAAALTAGLGGVALGAIPGAMGAPGFQQGMAIDPEDPRITSNTPGAMYSVSPYASTQYM